ncbi:MAG: hypothetical protein CM15mV61_050 [uncultured marine virus]|nr:MAG: hypothetical protein CM15mV61_050 [uncultured marine virus]
MDVLEETENKAIFGLLEKRGQDIRDAIKKKYGPRSVVVLGVNPTR